MIGFDSINTAEIIDKNKLKEYEQKAIEYVLKEQFGHYIDTLTPYVKKQETERIRGIMEAYDEYKLKHLLGDL